MHLRLGTALAGWTYTNLYYVFLPFVGAAPEAGLLRAVALSLMPMQLAQGALGLVLVPRCVRARSLAAVTRSKWSTRVTLSGTSTSTCVS